MDETCADDIDTNCDGILGDINGNADSCTSFYLDADGDGQGAIGSGTLRVCVRLVNSINILHIHQ